MCHRQNSDRACGRCELEELAASVLRREGLPDVAGAFADSSFVRLGGDSLRAMRLGAEALDRLGVTIPVRALLGERPLGEVLSQACEVVPPRPGRSEPVTVPASATEPSPAQRGMWIGEHLLGGTPYNLAFVCFVDGPLRRDILDTAIASTVRRHEGLRMIFPEVDGQITRKTGPGVPSVSWRRHAGAPSDFDADVRATAAREGRALFDLGVSAPLRFTVLSHGTDRHALIFTVHHILLDAWAIGLALEEIFSRYSAAERGRRLDLKPAVSFGAYLDWQERLRATGELDRQAAFWARHLDGVPDVLEVPADRARPATWLPDGALSPFDLGPALSDAVVASSRKLGITPTAFLLGAYALTLSRYTGADSLLIGMPMAGGPTPELAELVAVTVNAVPVRIDIDDDLSCAEYLRRVQESLALSLEHADIPFAELVALSAAGPATDRHPLVQVAFGVHDQLIPKRFSTGTLSIRVEEGHGGGSQFDMELFIRSSEPSFAGDLEYATSVWRPEEAAGLCADLKAAVRELTADPAAPLASARCIASARRARLCAIENSRAYPDESIDELFRMQARRTPDAIAVRAGSHRLTYCELAAAAAWQARSLSDAGVSPGDTVLVTEPRSIAEVVAVLGTLWAGAAYVGVEADVPDGRAEHIVSLLRPAAVIGRSSQSDWLASLPRVPSWDAARVGRSAASPPALPSDPDRLAYIAFTSGSTGHPKGVCIPHRGVVRLVWGLESWAPMGPGDRMMRISPLSFDVSSHELWGPLLTGACIEVFPEGPPSPRELSSFIAAAGVTHAILVSGVFGLISEFALDGLAGMRCVITGGDVIPPEPVERVLRRHPGIVVVNAYGPTENATYTTVHRLTSDAPVDSPLPIGTPVANTQVYVLDRRRRLVPPGAVGDLYAAGDGLATGYFGDGPRTAQVFGELSPDIPSRLYRTGDVARLDSHGRLQFLGRSDDQVKIRGFRVEPGEIRHAIVAHPQVCDAFVTVIGNGGDDRQLLAGCAPAAGSLDVAELSEFISARLPRYMIPGLWAIVDELPLNANGKVDRRALQRMAKPASHWPAAG